MKDIVKKDSIVTIKHIVGETANDVIQHIDGNEYKFTCDAYVAGETCRGGFFHLRQARKVEPGKHLGHNIKFWPRLRKALHEAGLTPINIPGGDYPIHYQDELVVPDYSMSGAHYFVIKRKEIGKYLDLLPLDDEGKKRVAQIAEAKRAAREEEYRQEHDPQCIAKRIGDELWYSSSFHDSIDMNSEFCRLTCVPETGDPFSVIYPTYPKQWKEVAK